MNLAGTHHIIVYSVTGDLVTIDHAATIVPRGTDTHGKITELAPIHTSSHISTSFSSQTWSNNEISLLVEWLADVITTHGHTRTFFQKVIFELGLDSMQEFLLINIFHKNVILLEHANFTFFP